MPTDEVGLYIGKFQPFHNGHLSVITHVAPSFHKLIIAIGSSQYGGSKDQPFYASDRRRMISGALADQKIDNCEVIEIPDIHDAERWVDHVRQYAKFDVVFTGNEQVRQLFEAKSIEVKPVPFLPGVTGTLVRQKLANGDSDWQKLVPPATADVIRSQGIPRA
jgi:nicotinamide-nucleotide adenylyltransferase